jgi:HTH-type transcriptional regulator, competence development regulator
MPPTLPRLRAIRIQRALSQAELAERAGVSRVAVTRLESGEVDARFATIRKLAAALDVQPDELMKEPINTDAYYSAALRYVVDQPSTPTAFVQTWNQMGVTGYGAAMLDTLRGQGLVSEDEHGELRLTPVGENEYRRLGGHV